jgi:hypothetical protein
VASDGDTTFTLTGTNPIFKFIAYEFNWFTSSAETVGVIWSMASLTDVRTYTLPDKNITLAGINNEKFTGSTNFNANAFAGISYIFSAVNASDSIVVLIDASALTNGYGFDSESQTAASTWTKSTYGYGGAGTYLSYVQGANVTGYIARLAHASGIGLDITTEGMTAYNQVMARIAHNGGSMTASNTQSQLFIARTASALNGFDMTGAKIELNKGAAVATTGDYIKCWDGTTTKFKIDYTGAITMWSNTSPTLGADQAGIYVADITAGNAAIHAKSEAGDLIKLYKYTNADFGNTINTGDSDTDDAIIALIAAGVAHGLIST